jgi:transcriptional regulator with XRE-family HTH domain
MVDTRPLMRQLAERRRALGLTQQAVADVTGKVQSTVSGWETGTYEPTLTDVEDYARLVGCWVTLTPREQDGGDTRG